MVKYSGSFAGCLACFPDPDVTYKSSQSAMVSVRQQDQTLALTVINNINRDGQLFELVFDYVNLIDPVQLVFETYVTDNQFNRDNPITVTQLILDDLFTIPYLLQIGILMTGDNQSGNVLWKTGQLVYTFNLPLVSNI